MSELTGGSESGADVWYLDLLLDETGSVTPLPAGLARPLWVSVMIPEEAVTGNYTVSVSVHDAYSGVLLAHVVVIITAWDMSLAQALRNFSDTAKFGGYLSRFYPQNVRAQTDPAVPLVADAQAAFDRERCAHRMPANTWTASRDHASDADGPSAVQLLLHCCAVALLQQED